MNGRVLSLGDQVAGHKVRGLIGAGAFGAVYEAEQPVTGRRVALKVVHPDVAADEDSRARAIQEARALAEISHPNIVTLYGAGISDEGLLWIAMELLTGWTLRETAAGPARMKVEQVMAILADIADGLSAAHDLHILHRDMKPENVFLTTQMRVVVLDFTAAKAAGRNLVQSTGERGEKGGRKVLGTPAYMSPEQVRGERVDTRSDIYSLGVMAYEFLYKHPFSNPDGTFPDELEMARRHGMATPKDLTEVAPEVPAGLWVLLKRMLHKQRDGRPSSMAVVSRELRQLRAATLKAKPTDAFEAEWRGPGSFAMFGEGRSDASGPAAEGRHPSRKVMVQGRGKGEATTTERTGAPFGNGAAERTRAPFGNGGAERTGAPFGNAAAVIHITAKRPKARTRRHFTLVGALLLGLFLLVLAASAWFLLRKDKSAPATVSGVYP